MLEVESRKIVCQFPIQRQKIIPPGLSLVLRDYEIFGANGLRERFVEDWSLTHKLEVILHPNLYPPNLRESYSEELERWQKKLPRAQFETSPSLITEDVLFNTLVSIFPISVKVLGPQTLNLMRLYLNEVDFNHLNLNEIFRYFPFFLKNQIRYQLGYAWQIARWEWIFCELEYSEVLFSKNGTINDIELNPSLYRVNQEVPLPELDLAIGRYIIFVDPKTLYPKYVSLQSGAHLIFDLLESEVAFNKKTLIKLLQDQNSFDLNWEDTLSELYDLGAIQ